MRVSRLSKMATMSNVAVTEERPLRSRIAFSAHPPTPGTSLTVYDVSQPYGGVFVSMRQRLSNPTAKDRAGPCDSTNPPAARRDASTASLSRKLCKNCDLTPLMSQFLCSITGIYGC